jgi:hypothetical protein
LFKQQPGERDLSLLQQPDLLKKVRLPSQHSSCEQVEQRVKPEQAQQPLIIRHLPADIVAALPDSQVPVQAAVLLVDPQSELNQEHATGLEIETTHHA